MVNLIFLGTRGNVEATARAHRIKNLNCRKVYVYFNNDANAFAVKNAQMLREELS